MKALFFYFSAKKKANFFNRMETGSVRGTVAYLVLELKLK